MHIQQLIIKHPISNLSLILYKSFYFNNQQFIQISMGCTDSKSNKKSDNQKDIKYKQDNKINQNVIVPPEQPNQPILPQQNIPVINNAVKVQESKEEQPVQNNPSNIKYPEIKVSQNIASNEIKASQIKNQDQEIPETPNQNIQNHIQQEMQNKNIKHNSILISESHLNNNTHQIAQKQSAPQIHNNVESSSNQNKHQKSVIEVNNNNENVVQSNKINNDHVQQSDRKNNSEMIPGQRYEELRKQEKLKSSGEDLIVEMQSQKQQNIKQLFSKLNEGLQEVEYPQEKKYIIKIPDIRVRIY